MALHDPGNGRKADTRAGKLVRGVQTSEGLEQVIGELHIEPYAVVLDVEHMLAAVVSTPDLDAGSAAPPGVFPGILEQIDEGDRQQAPIPLNLG